MRYLFGPLTTHFAEQNLHAQRARGECVAFGYEPGLDVPLDDGIDCWEALLGRLPATAGPQGGESQAAAPKMDFIVLYLPYTPIPAWLWRAPVPIVGLAADWNLLWDHYLRVLPSCDLVLTDEPGVRALGRAGLTQARPANLFGLERDFVASAWPEVERDIDILFIGNLHPAVQRERLAWLGRLAELAGHRKVVIETNAWGAEYRKLLARARIVFNRSIRGECNRRVFEAVAAGALLFQEAGNAEVEAIFRDRVECVYYSGELNHKDHEGHKEHESRELEELLDYYLDHEEERQAIANKARERIHEFTFSAMWDRLVQEFWFPGSAWEPTARKAAPCSSPLVPKLLFGNALPRNSVSPVGDLLMRGSAALSGAVDPKLADDIRQHLARSPGCAAWHNLLGLLEGSGGEAAKRADAAGRASAHFRRALALAPTDALVRLNLAEALAIAGQVAEAIPELRQVLNVVERETQDIHRKGREERDEEGGDLNAMRFLAETGGENSGALSRQRNRVSGQGVPKQEFGNELNEEQGGALRAVSYQAEPGNEHIAQSASNQEHGNEERAFGHYPAAYDVFRVEWERAGWANAGDLEAEKRAKNTLMAWRARSLLAALTDDLHMARKAAEARPDLPATRALLGAALARHGQSAEAIEHLRQATVENPFDLQAALALFQVLGETGDIEGQRHLAARYRRLHRAAPRVVPLAQWMAATPGAAGELVSIIVPVCNQVEFTRQCLESVLRHSRRPFEMIVVDNGSTDGTGEYLNNHSPQPGGDPPGTGRMGRRRKNSGSSRWPSARLTNPAALACASFTSIKAGWPKRANGSNGWRTRATPALS